MKHRRGPFSEFLRMSRNEADPELTLYRVRARRERLVADAKAQGMTDAEVRELLVQGIEIAEQRVYGEGEPR